MGSIENFTGQIKLYEMEMKKTIPTELRKSIKIMAYIVAPALVFLICQFLWNQCFDVLWHSTLTHEEINAVSSCVFLPFVVFVYVSKISSVPLRKHMKMAAFFSAAVAGAALLFLYLQVAQKREMESLLYLLGFGIAGPIIEEIVYRGFVFMRSQIYFQDWQSILLSALLFAVGHHSVASVALAFIAGVIFAIAMKQTKRLLIPICLHIVWNLTNLL